MNKLILRGLLLTTIIALQSCISFNTTGINRLSKTLREMMSRPAVALDQLEANDTIYLVNDSMVE